MAKWFQPPRIQTELESSVNLVLLCSGSRISSSRNKLAKCTQRLTGITSHAGDDDEDDDDGDDDGGDGEEYDGDDGGDGDGPELKDVPRPQ